MTGRPPAPDDSKDPDDPDVKLRRLATGLAAARGASTAAWITLCIVFAVGMAVDLASKSLAFQYVGSTPVILNREEIIHDPTFQIPWHQPVHILPGRLLDFNLVINRGAVFGLGENRRVAFIAFTAFAAAAGLFVFTRWTSARDRLAHIALGLILAGGIGNLYDRINFGVVRDFLHMFPGRKLPFGLSWPGGNPELFPWVFNVADVLLLTGMSLLMIHLNRAENPRDSRNPRKVQSDAAPPRPGTPVRRIIRFNHRDRGLRIDQFRRSNGRGKIFNPPGHRFIERSDGRAAKRPTVSSGAHALPRSRARLRT